MIASFAVGGFFSAGRVSVGYCYLMEFSPKKNATWMSTVWNIHDSLTIVWTILFYRFVSSNWHNTLYWCSFVQAISIIFIMCFIPESPKWLYDQKEWTKLKKVMTYMAKKNGKTMKSAGIIEAQGLLRESHLIRS